VVIDDPDAAFADRPEALFRLEPNAELAHRDHIERCVKVLRHLERDRHAAARQAEHNYTGTAQMPQPVRQVPAGVGAVNEQHFATSKRIPMLMRPGRGWRR
jgi:hypothetical protein